ncbi:MAG: alpha/beta hydrolase family protein [Nitrososphaeria archaeon]
MKILALHGKGSDPAKIAWLISPLKIFGDVDAPYVDIEANEFLKSYLKTEYDIVAGHSRGGTYALLYSAFKGKPVIAVSSPSDRLKQSEYLKGFQPGTVQKRLYEDLQKIQKEYLAETSPINYADKIKNALLIHGSEDDIVPVQQSEELCKKIVDSGGKCRLYVIKMRHTPPASRYSEIHKIIESWVRDNVS